MSRGLRLYTNLTCNYDDHVHYFFTNNNLNYFLNTFIETNRLTTLTLDNYRINANVAKCNINETLTLANYQNVTMLADVEEENGNITYLRFYRVISSYFQSGYVIYNVEVDLWQTYIHLCGPSIMNIQRSNRVIANGGGYFDEIPLTDGDLQYELYDGQASLAPVTHYKSTAVWLVFLLQYNVEQAVFGEDHVSQTELYGASLSDLAAKATGTVAQGRTDLEKALAIIGGVYGVTASGIGDNDAQVLKAWIIPHSEIEEANYGLTIKSKTHFNSGSVNVTITKILPSKNITTHTINNYDPNKLYYAGTYNNGLKLRNYAVDKLTYNTITIVTDSEVKVIAQQGERQQDITQGYEVKLTTNGAQKTELRKLAEAFSTSVSLGLSSAKMIMAGGAGVTGGLLTIGAGIANQVNQFGIESARGNGDGFLTYYQTNPLDEVLSPYCVTYFTSVRDEVLNAEQNGLVYANLPYEELVNNFFIDELPLTEGVIDYLQANVHCSNAPKDAIQFIEGEFARGIHIQVIVQPEPEPEPEPEP